MTTDPTRPLVASRPTLLGSSIAALAMCAVGALGFVGCGNIAPPPTTGTGCNATPFECAAGTTCWLRDETPTYACLPSGLGKDGDSCLDEVGVATCADGYTCLQLSGGSGLCRKYCEPSGSAHPCPAGQVCSTAHLTSFDAGASAPSFAVCTPM
jgi:hypothetical protein